MDGRIAFVGSSEDARSCAGAEARVVDLSGLTAFARDLGILREVRVEGGVITVIITPTYSG